MKYILENMSKTPDRRPVKASYRTPTGAWKEKYRRGCIERLKNARQDLMNSMRSTNDSDVPQSPSNSQEIVNKVMLDEWRKMKLESPLFSRLPNCTYSPRNKITLDFDDDEFDNIEEILDVFENIQQELMREEMQMLAKYEESLSFDENYLCAAIDLLSTENVLCPVCKRNNLLQNKQVIFCYCGVRIDTKEDAVNMKFVSRQLETIVSEHSSACDTEPDFSVVDISGTDISNLIMTCQKCDCMEIII